MAEQTVTALEFTTTLPPQELSPNHRQHWAEKHRAFADYKGEVFIDCRVALGKPRAGLPWNRAALGLPWPRARLSLVFGTAVRVGDERYHPRDCDNALSSFKAGLDGIVQAGIVRDDNAKYVELGDIRIDPESYGVTVRLERLEKE